MIRTQINQKVHAFARHDTLERCALVIYLNLIAEIVVEVFYLRPLLGPGGHVFGMPFSNNVQKPKITHLDSWSTVVAPGYQCKEIAQGLWVDSEGTCRTLEKVMFGNLMS